MMMKRRSSSSVVLVPLRTKHFRLKLDRQLDLSSAAGSQTGQNQKQVPPTQIQDLFKTVMN